MNKQFPSSEADVRLILVVSARKLLTMMTTAYMYIMSLMVTRGLCQTSSAGSDDTASAITSSVTRGPSSTLFSSDVCAASVVPCSGSDVVFEQSSQSVIHCSLMCAVNKCCDGYHFTESSGTCVGCRAHSVHVSLSTQVGGTTFFKRDGGSVINGSQWEEFNGSFYKLFHLDAGYAEVKAYCQELCGYPVHINSQSEADFSKTLIENRQAYIGLEFDLTTKQWIWGDDGSIPTAFDWRWKQPDGNGLEGCALLSVNGWDDYPCDKKASVLCERY